ncbi:MAG: DUF427 domain-containing protein [Ilumatobacteraceae bacterium]
MVRAIWNGAVIAESDDTVVVEGNHYFTRASVNYDHLLPSTTTTVCGWKGRASYYSIEVDGKVNRDAAWYYPIASPAASSIEGRIAFWRGVRIDDGRRAGRRSLLDRFRRSHTVATPPDHGRDQAPGATAGDDHAVATLDETTFFNALVGRVTIADFWAPWCGPCQALHPLFEAQAARHANDIVRFVRINVDDSSSVAAACNIMSIPTIIVFDTDGHQVDREVGVPSPKRFDELVGTAQSIANRGEVEA